MGTLEPYSRSHRRVVRADSEGHPLHIVYGRTMDSEDVATEIPVDPRAVRSKRIGNHKLSFETQSVDDLQPLLTNVPKPIRIGAGLYVLTIRLVLLSLGAVILCVLGIKFLIWMW